MMCNNHPASLRFLIDAIFISAFSRTAAMHRGSTTIPRDSMGKFLSPLITILIALIALTHTALAQDTSKIPTLQLWYESKGISWVHYLQDYDTNNGGSNALMVSKDGSNPNVWYLDNGRIDTTTKPTPPCNAWWVGQADLNGDGIQEIIDFDGNVFTSPSKGSPPSTTPIFRYGGRFAGARMFIDDFNADGKQDILSLGTIQFCKILLGGNDLTKLNVIYLPFIPNTAYSEQYIVGAWRDSDGSNKMVVYQQTDTSYTLRTEAFFLYSFQIQGDKVSYTALDTTTFKDFKDKWTPYYFYESSFVWHSNDNKEHSLVAAYGQTDMYRIENNTLQFKWTKRRREGSGHYLLGNTSDTVNTGFVRGANPDVLLYSANPVNDTLAKARFPMIRNGQKYESVHSIGDINNDGFGDIAVVYGTEDFLTIYLGRSSVPTSVTDDMKTDITLNNNQPCSRNGVLTVNLSQIEERGEAQLMLYSLSGAIAADLGLYPIADATLTIPLTRYALSPGLYNLRCTIGKQVIDKGLIITE